MTAPGWYRDTQNSNLERYWNGSTYSAEQGFTPPAKAWPAAWYPIVDDPSYQREWDGQRWTTAARQTKRIFRPGVGVDPKKATAAVTAFRECIDRLYRAQRDGRRGEARVAWTAAYAQIDQAFGPDGPSEWKYALSTIEFDHSVVTSPLIGSVPAYGGTFQVYEDFVIFDGQALDNTRHSTLGVFQGGQKQVTIVNVTDKKGRVRPVEQVHDLRTAAIQVSGPTGTIRADFHPDLVGQAQQIAAQFNARIQALAPPAVTSADLQAMVDAILNASGPSAAEKLKQLDRLRYDRLLSDEEWNRAKARILDKA